MLNKIRNAIHLFFEFVAKKNTQRSKAVLGVLQTNLNIVFVLANCQNSYDAHEKPLGPQLPPDPEYDPPEVAPDPLAANVENNFSVVSLPQRSHLIGPFCDE